jgi:hypothetical protein
MNNWCICWVFTHIFAGILIFKGLTAQRFYKSFGVKGLINKPFGRAAFLQLETPDCEQSRNVVVGL